MPIITETLCELLPYALACCWLRRQPMPISGASIILMTCKPLGLISGLINGRQLELVLDEVEDLATEGLGDPGSVCPSRLRLRSTGGDAERVDQQPVSSGPRYEEYFLVPVLVCAPVLGDDLRNLRRGCGSGSRNYCLGVLSFCPVDSLVNALVSSRQLCRFVNRELFDVLAPVFRASVHCVAVDQLFVMDLHPADLRPGRRTGGYLTLTSKFATSCPFPSIIKKLVAPVTVFEVTTSIRSVGPGTASATSVLPAITDANGRGDLNRIVKPGGISI